MSMSRFALCAALALATTLSAPSPAAAEIGDVTTYETIDAIEPYGGYVKITGVIAGQSNASEIQYQMLSSGGSDAWVVNAARCERLALLAMSKPGKYTFALTQQWGGQYSCKLSLVAP
jgi:hypothetical protein